jgi:radical SAM superfamily enzyme YgiQ (UPF0313 family)
MNKVLLANLPWQKNARPGVRAGSRWPHIKEDAEKDYLPFPFFLAYATSLLEKNGHNVFIIDAIAEDLSEDRFLKKLCDIGADYLVAETSIPSFYDDLLLLRKISDLGVRIILCGPNAEIYDPRFLKENAFISFVLFGEYELTSLELVAALKDGRDLSGVDGLIFRQGERVVKNKKREPLDINVLPWPHRKTLPMHRYLDAPGEMPLPSVQMMASRGCPFGCSFCLWPQVMYQGNLYRARNVRDVCDEMECLVRENGFKSVYFDDDTFNIGKDRMLHLCREFRHRGLDKIPWAIMARPDLMDEETLKALKEAGLWAVKYGVESADKNLTDAAGKNMDLKKAEAMIRLTNQLGIRTHLTFTLGLKGENRQTIEKTIRFAQRLDPFSLQFSITTPFPGTALFEDLDKNKRILTKDWNYYDGHYNCVFQPEGLTASELEKAKEEAYRECIEFKRRKRGLCGSAARFFDHFHSHGLRKTIKKTVSYLTE